ncbi:HD domain-containing phosphohydrolase [Vibrio ostreicida]|uniref:Response regulator n=1 Tax=Vibrio ostreicida TaxID=526588 RepID=A0ABT8BTD5_9VIBR|nr:HD domain-containing phosphohydrolase [Vibrio ostreicida]MDN3609939.1 response regulator [Vibrio ostreicida]NPD10368.1 response regulator [Vibrio ostreicida]
MSEDESSPTAEKLNLLLLDDETDILKSLTRVLRYDYQVVSFSNGQEALKHLESNEVSIIISDMRMPEMDGAEFLTKAREICPHSIRFLLTGYSDMESTIRAVNDGGIHTYIAKPWDNEGLKLTLSKASELFELRRQKQELTDALQNKNQELSDLNGALEDKVKQRTAALQESNKKMEALLSSRTRTFKDILSALSAIIQHATGQPHQQSERVAEYSKLIAIRMEAPESEVTHCYLSALLHEIGLIGQTEIIQEVEEPQEGAPEGAQIRLAPPANAQVGAKIIGQIKRFTPLVEIIRHQDENFDGTGSPQHLSGDDIPLGARILRVAKNYDFFVSSPQNTARIKPSSARVFIKQHAGTLYDPKVVTIFLELLENADEESDVDLCVGLDELKIGSVLKQDVYHPNGQMMLSAGQEINEALLNRLKLIEESVEVPIAVYI